MTPERMSTEEAVHVAQTLANSLAHTARTDRNMAVSYRREKNEKVAADFDKSAADFQRDADAVAWLLEEYKRMKEALRGLATTSDGVANDLCRWADSWGDVQPGWSATFESSYQTLRDKVREAKAALSPGEDGNHA